MRGVIPDTPAEIAQQVMLGNATVGDIVRGQIRARPPIAEQQVQVGEKQIAATEDNTAATRENTAAMTTGTGQGGAGDDVIFNISGVSVDLGTDASLRSKVSRLVVDAIKTNPEVSHAIIETVANA